MSTQDDRIADDLLHGANEIAVFLFGTDDFAACRRVYHLASRRHADRLPLFKFGGQLAARKSTLREAFARMERGEAAA